ncbi:PhoP regulatory network protein YrbL [Yoonia rosea]|uniref:PhoP regulatory network protein YrbL n=1 Tax=Yoonia rosea TaxID=287098 RepID=A0A1R3XI92_9RHOB|nr:YrbL family protein [Yoonia rosea]SIT90555.1 PhoP regulatory network protein YrbL [Yoonia rosea]
MIKLNPEDRIAKGGGRDIYQHPDDDGLLIKIYRPKKKRFRLGAYFELETWWFGGYREWYVEYKHYIACLNRRGNCPLYMSELRGFSDTSLGLGQLVQKISDEGSPGLSITLRHVAKQQEISFDDIAPLVDQLFQDFGDDKVIFRDLNPSNILVVRDADKRPLRLVIIDGLGDYTYIPTRSYSRIAYRLWHKHEKSKVLAYLQEQYAK